ncbi:enhancer of mRNA-decapping protein 4 [Scleropages formosus]|uniref:Enhancer of mRNA-decapping protein 4 n=1 Tax=Scleropages formosus TaxID=113540 RepID=A0A8C9RSZ6_SCLFO|nr:enhancer of mRNA-decapping protein 4-like [Scleropages formosus]
MAAHADIDIEDATQRLRDILKLDRGGSGADGASAERQKAPFNGDLNGLFGADAPSGGERAAPADSTARGVDVGARDRQIICLTGDDSSTSIAIFGSNVEIVASHDSSINSKARGSNRVKIQPVAKYDWEHKYYHGNLIAVSNLHLAYTIRGANSYAMIRVLSLGTAERTLLKGFTGAVTDLAFAHLDSNQLACLDEAGNLFVWLLTSHGGKIQDEIVVYIQRPADTPLNLNRRLIWCPFIPEDNEENPEDACQTLALLHEDRAEVWDLDILIANNSSWPADATDLNDGFVTVRGHQAPISEGALSPDGAVLATASHDGYVKFWQIYIEGQDHPRCLHEWKPHSGRPLSCLLFCDNHKKQDPDVPFWRFLITGADQNRELKMWCTVSWSCLQTVRFSPDHFSPSVMPTLKASLDLSAEFLILSDVQRKVLYVMELVQDQEKGMAAFTAISEFLLTHPVLSFGIQDVSRGRMRHTEVLPPDEESESTTNEGSHGALEAKADQTIQIKLYCIHTKSLQDVQVCFQPYLGTADVTPHDNSQASYGYVDHLAETGIEGLCSDKGSHFDSQNDLQRIPSLPTSVDFLSPVDDAKPKLMTPDAFMTPTASIPASPGGGSNSLTPATPMSRTPGSSSGRPVEDPIQSPKMSLESGSLSLSSMACSSAGLPPSSCSNIILIPGLGDQLPSNNIQVIPSPKPPLSLDLQAMEPLLVLQASPTRERSPDVISSASTVLPQDIPEIASETLPRDPTLHADCMVSAASALHMLSPRTPRGSEHSAGTGVGGLEGERIGSTPSLLEAALSQENTGVCSESSSSQPWPAAPDITRETRGSLRDNNLSDCSHKEMKEKHKASLYHRHSYSLTQNDSQDASAEQSDHDDEVTSLASSSVNCASKSSRRLQVKDWKVSPRSSPKLKRKSKKDDGDYSQYRQIDQKFAQLDSDLQEELILLLRGQQQDIAELRQSQLEVLQRFVAHLDTMQRSIVDHVEHVMAAQQERDQQRMQHMVSAEQDHSRQLQEQLSQQLAHSLTTSVSNRLDKLFRDELRKTLPQTISRSLEPLTGQLSSTIGAKLTAVEGMLKENVIKVVKSKNTMDTIGRAAAEAIQGPIHAAYKDTFQGVVLPTFEKGCQSMFLQINDSFRQGTNEYIQQLESHTKSRKQREQEPRNHLIGQLQTLIDTLQTSIDQLAASITSSVRSEVQHQLHMVVGNLQDSILAQVQQAVKGEVTMAMKEQQAAVTSSIMQAMRSAAGTPIPSAHLDYQVQQTSILQLLQQGHINQAFQQALSAADLNLVLYVCETVDSQQVFGQQPCPLIQPVLLSLIQQLSTNLTTRSELKISYLEDALMNLDHTNPVTQDHMSSVLSQLRQKLFQFLQLDPHGRLHKRARRLLLMLQGLVSR